MFLIRDWPYPDEFKYGVEGGEKYMKTFLQTTNYQNEEIKAVREYIRNAFENLSCALLPHPGFIVNGSKGTPYNGCWKEMEENFKEELKNVIEHLLSPKNLVIKKINGEILKGLQYHDIIKDYFEHFKSNQKLPKVQTILEATIERQMTFIINDCFNRYKEQLLNHEELIENPDSISVIHEHDKKFALSLYDEARKMGSSEHQEKFQKLLENQIDEFFEEWNDRTKKNLMIEQEMERIRKSLEEKEQQYQEQLRAEREANEQLRELRDSREREIAEERARNETERTRNLEVERARNDSNTHQLLELLINVAVGVLTSGSLLQAVRSFFQR